MPFLVTSPLVLVKVPGDPYRVDYHYQGETIPWLSDEQEAHFIGEGLVEKVGRRAAAESDGGGDPAAADAVPAKVATKDVWVDFAVSKGADRAEAEALTKPELIELYG